MKYINPYLLVYIQKISLELSVTAERFVLMFIINEI